tara:strand:+ start:7875 stop:8528 length:654 start_codon:yes stop_codon:yes gene_type:complete
MKRKIRSLIEIFVIVAIFIIIGYLVQSNLDFFKDLIGGSVYGLLIYVLVILLAMVVAPISSIPLIPLMSNVWGWKVTGAVSIIGWTLGSIIVFWICRLWGVKIVGRLISLRQVHAWESKIPQENLFFVVFWLRMIIPVDILSYALGLFSKIKFWPYTIATFLGVIPAAFALAYLGTLNFSFQLIIFLIAGIIFLCWWILRERERSELCVTPLRDGRI